MCSFCYCSKLSVQLFTHYAPCQLVKFCRASCLSTCASDGTCICYICSLQLMLTHRLVAMLAFFFMLVMALHKGQSNCLKGFLYFYTAFCTMHLIRSSLVMLWIKLMTHYASYCALCFLRELSCPSFQVIHSFRVFVLIRAAFCHASTGSGVFDSTLSHYVALCAMIHGLCAVQCCSLCKGFQGSVLLRLHAVQGYTCYVLLKAGFMRRLIQVLCF